jgi:hypothetical protein
MHDLRARTTKVQIAVGKDLQGSLRSRMLGFAAMLTLLDYLKRIFN